MTVTGEFEGQRVETLTSEQLVDFETLHGTHIITGIALTNTVEFRPEAEPFSLEIDWLTIQEMALELGKGYSWVQRRISQYEEYSVYTPGVSNRSARRYPFWVIDELRKELDVIETYPYAEDEVTLEMISEMTGRTTKWVENRLGYLGVKGKKMLDSINRPFTYYPREIVEIILGLPEDLFVKSRWAHKTNENIIDFFNERVPNQVVTHKLIRELRQQDKSVPGHSMITTHFGSMKDFNDALAKNWPLPVPGPVTAIVDPNFIPRAQYVKIEPYVPPEVDEPEGPLAWREKALCAQTAPEAFFPDKGDSARMAKKICQMCEVKIECLDYALANDERFGVWGGLNERERRKLSRAAQTA